MCGYGSPYQKPTTFKGTGPWLPGLANSCNHRIHEAILGGQAERSIKTSEAAAYPEFL